MDARNLEELRTKTDAYILAGLTLYSDDYTQEGLQALREVAAERGLFRAHIDAFRDLLATKDRITVSCLDCQRLQVIDQDELIAGEYCCASCDEPQTIDFKSSPPAPRSIRQMLEALDDGSLLRAFVFREGKYRQGEFDLIREILDSRGFSDDNVSFFQSTLCSGESAEAECRRCGKLLIISSDGLWKGDTVCPSCKERQFIDFKSLKPVEATASGDMREQEGEYRGVFTDFHEDTPVTMRGLRGWLIFIGLSLVLELALLLLWAVVSWSEGDHAFVYAAMLPGGFIIYLLYLFLRKSKRFPPLFILFVLIDLGFSTLGLILTILFPTSGEPLKDSVGSLLRGIVYAVIWIPYMKTSKRVKATFVN